LGEKAKLKSAFAVEYNASVGAIIWFDNRKPEQG
jgi:hypothetical protein